MALNTLTPPSLKKPWLLYAYPWMPYPRRVILYLKEKEIPEHQVKIVHVRDPKFKNEIVDDDCPPKPSGSLPILAIPSSDPEQPYVYIRQSIAILQFLENVCVSSHFGFQNLHGSFLGEDFLAQARVLEVMGLAEECLVGWNPVRWFGTKAGAVSIPEAAKEMIGWVRRSLMTIETYFQGRDMSVLKDDRRGHITMADIVLYQFLEFIDDCYGVDMTIGSGEVVRDVYGREVKEEFPNLVKFYQAFKTRRSAVRDASKGEVAPDYASSMMSTWADGVL